MACSKNVQTRVMILSDTHGMDFTFDETPLHEADVVIHCGDLTDESKISEFETTIKLLERLNAPLKLVIAGNHDFTMDLAAFDDKIKESGMYLEPELIEREYGAPGEARALFETAVGHGVVLLNEGTHHFRLKNGAKLTIFASPYTPALGNWGFQYHPNKGHGFAIEEGTDVVITHGPPKGIMDYTHGRERAGCPDLFAAVARVRPRLHCFGHIHEGWGARSVRWRDQARIGEQIPTHFTAIDNENSWFIEKLSSLCPSKFDSPEEAMERTQRANRYSEDRCCKISHGDNLGSRDGKQTLFVNASICDIEGALLQKPWLVDIDLSSAD